MMPRSRPFKSRSNELTPAAVSDGSGRPGRTISLKKTKKKSAISRVYTLTKRGKRLIVWHRRIASGDSYLKNPELLSKKNKLTEVYSK